MLLNVLEFEELRVFGSESDILSKLENLDLSWNYQEIA
jgi:hypothetical protein